MYSILILTQYYPPETGAPQNRLSSLAKHLQQSGARVSVLTAMPNYPQMSVHEGYRGKFFTTEVLDGIQVNRSWIFAKKGAGIFSRLLNYFSFVFSAIIAGIFKIKKHDIILCESPPLFLGISALILKRIKRSKLVFNVSDLWPETAESLGIIRNRLLLSVSKRLEERMYRRSELITGQTKSIVSNIQQRFPDKQILWFRNGADINKFSSLSFNNSWRAAHGYQQDDFIVLYGGILGYAQNLEVILRAAKLLTNDTNIKFVIVGDGPNKETLLALHKKLDLHNTSFLPAMPATELLNIVYNTDAGIIPLRHIPLFKGAIPSKIFEYLFFEKPILLGVDGEAKELFIQQSECGLFFTPQNEHELAEATLKLANDTALRKKLGQNGRNTVLNRFNREKIAAELHEVLKQL